jgi:hypothetical protein
VQPPAGREAEPGTMTCPWHPAPLSVQDSSGASFRADRARHKVRKATRIKRTRGTHLCMCEIAAFVGVQGQAEPTLETSEMVSENVRVLFTLDVNGASPKEKRLAIPLRGRSSLGPTCGVVHVCPHWTHSLPPHRRRQTCYRLGSAPPISSLVQHSFGTDSPTW